MGAQVVRPSMDAGFCRRAGFALVVLTMLSGLPRSAWAVDVPFKIETGSQSFEGVGTLVDGHFSGHGRFIGGAFDIVGVIEGKKFTITASGHLCTGTSSVFNTSGGGTGRPSTGKVSITFSAYCLMSNPPIVATFDLPPASGGSSVASQQPATAPAVAPVPAAPTTSVAAANLDFGRYEALVIGNDKYQGLPALKTAAGDAQAVAQTLKDAYGFKVTLLLNATRAQIMGALAKYRQTLTGDDNLLIYYAGHGSFDESGDQGYWLPVDAMQDDPTNWVSNTDITTMLKAIQARHVMVVADSCYSGTLTRDANVGIKDADYLQRMVEKKARTVMTSGGLEPVADSGGSGHSVFASAFIAALQQNSGIMTAQAFFIRVREPVVLAAAQTPEYSNLRFAGHEGGDFVFVRRP